MGEFLLVNNLSITLQARASRFTKYKSFRRVTEKGYLKVVGFDRSLKREEVTANWLLVV